MVAWRKNFPQDIVNENEFYAQKWAEREASTQGGEAPEARVHGVHRGDGRP
jgi:hypothetical protein